MARHLALCSTLLAGAIALAGCSATSTTPPDAPPPGQLVDSSDPGQPAPPAKPAANDRPQSADAWCQTVYARAGVAEYVLGLRPDITDTTIRGSSYPADKGLQVGYALMCSGYGLDLVTATYANADVATERRALIAGYADIAFGEPDRIAGHDGEYLYSPPDHTGGGFGFSWQTELQDFTATLILPGVSQIPEDEARDVLTELVSAISTLPTPEPQPECLDAASVLAAAVAQDSDEYGLTEDGTAAVSELVVKLREKCGYDTVDEALMTLTEGQHVMRRLYDALGPR